MRAMRGLSGGRTGDKDVGDTADKNVLATGLGTSFRVTRRIRNPGLRRPVLHFFRVILIGKFVDRGGELDAAQGLV